MSENPMSDAPLRAPRAPVAWVLWRLMRDTFEEVEIARVYTDKVRADGDFKFMVAAWPEMGWCLTEADVYDATRSKWNDGSYEKERERIEGPHDE